MKGGWQLSADLRAQRRHFLTMAEECTERGDPLAASQWRTLSKEIDDYEAAQAEPDTPLWH